jgi:outer membrane protein OmpA-like peptidoglycan-associated protein
MTHGTRLGVLMAALALFGAGCATVDWTEDLFAKQKVEVDTRFDKVETSVREEGERIDRIEVRVANLDTRVSETHAQMRPTATAPNRAARGRTLIGVVHVPFGFDRADLEPGAEAALASIVKELRDHPTMTIDLEGTTDTVGRLDYNLRLSERRVEAVTRWLTMKGVHRTRIVGAKGRGPVISTSVKDEAKRRVMVKLMTSAE